MTRLSLILSTISMCCMTHMGAAASFAPSSKAFGIVSNIPRGGSEATVSYSTMCEGAKSSILGKASQKIEELQTKIVEEGTVVADFGKVADELCNSAIEEFASSVPDATDASSTATYDKKLAELESALDAPLQVLYLRQLAILREVALESYRAASRVSGTSDYEAMLQADTQFTSAAQASTRSGSDWDYSSDRSHLQSIMNDIASTRKKLMDVQIKSSEKQSTAMSFLQQQQQMIQQLQMQLYGQSSPWNVGMAYRIPDTNFNLQGSYQQGRANVQLSCVPDEYAPMLGANGFTNGVGPGNLGLSLNLSV